MGRVGQFFGLEKQSVPVLTGPVNYGSDDPGTRGLNEILEGRVIVHIPKDGSSIITTEDEGLSAQRVAQEYLDRNNAAKKLSAGGGNFSGTTDMGLQEIGSSSPSPWTQYLREEKISALMGEKGLVKYLEMKRNDGAIRGSLRLLKTPALAAHWFIEPGDESDRAKKTAEWLTAMWEEGMSHTFSQHLNEALLMADYGHSIFEKVFWERDGKLEWKKLAPRHPLDVQSWVWDNHGGIAGVRMKSDRDAEGLFIPVDKLIIYTYDLEGGDVRGTSALRSAYKHWYYKEQLYKIDAIQKERHGIGVPVIKLPPGYTPADRNLAEDLGRNLRTNERAHITLPPGWEMEFAALQGQPVDAMKSIDHHNEMIGINILAPFMFKGGKEEEQTMFLKSTRFLAENIAAVLTRHGYHQLVDMNFVRTPAYPKQRARRIGEWADLRVLSFAIRNLVGAGILTPDDPLEAELRKEFDLPLADPDTARTVATPQGAPVEGQTTAPPAAGDTSAPGAPKPAPAGPPKQAPAASTKVNPGGNTSGRDSSGRSGTR